MASAHISVHHDRIHKNILTEHIYLTTMKLHCSPVSSTSALPADHCAKKPVTTMLTYPWKCTVLHCNHLGNTWKPLVLMTWHFDYCPSASEGDNQSVRSSAPVVSRCFPGGYNVKLYISRGRLAWWLLAFLCCGFHCNLSISLTELELLFTEILCVQFRVKITMAVQQQNPTHALKPLQAGQSQNMQGQSIADCGCKKKRKKDTLDHNTKGKSVTRKMSKMERWSVFYALWCTWSACGYTYVIFALTFVPKTFSRLDYTSCTNNVDFFSKLAVLTVVELERMPC